MMTYDRKHPNPIVGYLAAFLVLIIQLAYLFIPLNALADTQDFNSAADSYLQSGAPNSNNSSEIIMNGLNETRDGLVRFDISSIPSGSTIISATLQLVATAVGSEASIKNYGAHRILTDWVESTVTWNTPGSTAGTHFATSATQTITISTAGIYTWDVTGDVTNFLNGSAANYGWRIIWSSNTSGTNKSVDFGTKENTIASNRPVLNVAYTLPTSTPAPASSGPTTGTINVVKAVINDNGGTKVVADFPLFINGQAAVSGQTYTFSAPAPVYTVTETGDPDYTRSFSGDCDINGQLNLSPGDNKFCIVTNNDIATPATTAVPFAFSNIDYNNDSKIDISDWSIFLSNWSSSDQALRTKDDLNNDGKIDVSDFSVFLVAYQLGSKL